MIDPETKNERARNYLRAAYFVQPEWIPCTVAVMPATWRKYQERVEDVLVDYPLLFPDFRKGQRDFDAVGDRRYAAGRFTDNWGCVWDNIAEGLDGAVVEHPLGDWADFEHYSAPDPLTEGEGWGPVPDWDDLRTRCERAKREGRIAWGGMPHGFMYMRLYYLRGFGNLMLDFATEEPRLADLVEMVLGYNMAAIEKMIECGAEFISFGDDLGVQRSLPFSPATWRKYLLPCYRQMAGRCRECGLDVYLHSDGHVLEIIPDLIEAGVTVLNPQIRANGLDGLEATAKGRICINLDLDRQLFPFATPRKVSDHIRTAAARLNTDAGGLMLYAECEPDVPLENIRAICATLEEIGGPA